MSGELKSIYFSKIDFIEEISEKTGMTFNKTVNYLCQIGYDTLKAEDEQPANK